MQRKRRAEMEGAGEASCIVGTLQDFLGDEQMR